MSPDCTGLPSMRLPGARSDDDFASDRSRNALLTARIAAGGNPAVLRCGNHHEVARMVAFLASDEASYTTGSEFIIDGGMTAGFNVME